MEDGHCAVENVVAIMKKSISDRTSWKDRRVLVTGGAGFVGSWLCHESAFQGARVVILDIKQTMPALGEPYDSVLKKTVFVNGDVRDASRLRTLFAEYNFDTVFHLAAYALVDEVLENPSDALDTNIMGTVRVLEESRKHSGVRVVVASSDKAYGIHTILPYEEHFSLLGENHPYDCSKACTDQIARMYAQVYKLPIAVARCGNIYGGGDLNFSRLIPGTIRALLHEMPIEIRSDGTYRRDYIYVRDVVSAFMRLAEELDSTGISGEAFNFGHNKPLEVLEVVALISKLMNKTHLKPIVLNTCKNEIPHQYLDASKSRSMLNWQPMHEIENCLAETIEWYRFYFQKI